MDRINDRANDDGRVDRLTRRLYTVMGGATLEQCPGHGRMCLNIGRKTCAIGFATFWMSYSEFIQPADVACPKYT